MSDSTTQLEFEGAFHRVAERHERVWVFMAMLLLSLLLIGTLFFVVIDYGVVAKTSGYQSFGPATAATRSFADAGLVSTGPKAYLVHMLAHMWAWTPSPLHVPQGATVTFYVTSADVLHGFQVQGTTINLTAVPGIVGSMTYTFTHPKIYNIICNEYCGIGHQSMIGQIVVDPEVRK
jgi:cytochrome c oxidase subunit 2